MAAVATLRAPLPAGDGDSPWTQCALGPNGRVYCALHRQIICFACRCDYSYVGSYIGELEAWELEAEAEGVPNHFPDSNVDVAMEQMDSPMGEISVDLSLPEVRTGNWHVFPEVFGQSHQEAQDIIQERWMPEHGEALFVNRHDPGQLIVFADGGCINNGKPSARAGWGLAFGPSPQSVVSGPLEAAGPFGADFVPTSQRAELRAVIAAVRSPAWVRRYGFRRLLVVSGSQYAVEGATDRLRTWSTSDRLKKKANVDMWNALQGEVERQKEHEGLAIQMLFTPKSGKLWGFAAGAVWAAKRQSATSEVLPRWTDPVA